MVRAARSCVALNISNAVLGLWKKRWQSIQLQACSVFVSRPACTRQRVKYWSGTPSVNSAEQTTWSGRAPLDPARAARPQMNDIAHVCLPHREPCGCFGLGVICETILLTALFPALDSPCQQDTIDIICLPNCSTLCTMSFKFNSINV